MFEKDNSTSIQIPSTFSGDIGFWKVSKIRMNDLPMKFNMSDMQSDSIGLDIDEGICDPCHFAIVDGKFLITEFNSRGPRAQSSVRNAINYYLKNNSESLPEILKEIQINPILMGDAEELIDRFYIINEASIKVATNYARLLRNEDQNSFGDMFASAELVDDMNLNLGFGLGRRPSENSLSKFERIKTTFKEIVRRDDFSGNVSLMKIRGKITEEGSPDEINILEALLKTKAIVAKLDSRSRAVDPIGMFEELAQAYVNNRAVLDEYLQR